MARQLVKVPGNQFAHLTRPRKRTETVCRMDHEGEAAEDNAPVCPFCARDGNLKVWP